MRLVALSTLLIACAGPTVVDFGGLDEAGVRGVISMPRRPDASIVPSRTSDAGAAPSDASTNDATSDATVQPPGPPPPTPPQWCPYTVPEGMDGCCGTVACIGLDCWRYCGSCNTCTTPLCCVSSDHGTQTCAFSARVCAED